MKPTLALLISLFTLNWVIATPHNTVKNLGRDTLKIGLRNPIEVIDPHQSLTLEMTKVCQQIFETLVTMDTKGTIRPRLAKNWTQDFQQNTLTFHLNKKAKFSNGHAVAAKDVIYSINRSISLKSSLSSFVKKVKALKGNRVEFTTYNSNFPLLLKLLSQVDTSIVRPVKSTFVGSGPFEVISLNKNKILLQRRVFDKKKFQWIEFLQNSDLPFTKLFEDLAIDEFDSTLELKNFPSSQIIRKIKPGIAFIALNTLSPTFKQKKNREVFSQLFDSSKWMEFFKLVGHPTNSLIPYFKSEKVGQPKQKMILKNPIQVNFGLSQRLYDRSEIEKLTKLAKQANVEINWRIMPFNQQIKSFKKGEIDAFIKLDYSTDLNFTTLFDPYFSKSNNNIHQLKNHEFDQLFLKELAKDHFGMVTPGLIKMDHYIKSTLLLAIPLYNPIVYRHFSHKIKIDAKNRHDTWRWNFPYFDYLKNEK